MFLLLLLDCQNFILTTVLFFLYIVNCCKLLKSLHLFYKSTPSRRSDVPIRQTRFPILLLLLCKKERADWNSSRCCCCRISCSSWERRSWPGRSRPRYSWRWRSEPPTRIRWPAPIRPGREILRCATRAEILLCKIAEKIGRLEGASVFVCPPKQVWDLQTFFFP